MQGIENHIKVFVKSFLFIVIFSFGGNSYGEEKPVLTKKIFKTGKALYEKQCAVCHGITGAADGKAAYLLYPKPRDFTRDKFRLVSTTNMEATDQDLFQTISRGMPGSAMPPWEYLKTEDRWALVYYVRYLSEFEKYKAAGEITQDMIDKEVPWPLIKKIVSKIIDEKILIKVLEEPEVTPESLAEGKALFLASCAGCHGTEGKGDGQKEMKDNLGYPLKPRDLTAGIYKGSSSSQDLYCRMIGGMPGGPMPSYSGALTEKQIWDLIHYVQTFSTPEIEERSHLRQQNLIAQKINGEISLDPLSQQWNGIKSNDVVLTPLWWRNERIEGIEVKAAYNEKKVAFYLTWPDSSPESDAVAVQSFVDGAAIQLSPQKDPPFFGMGEKNNPVYIWHWKASWSEDLGDRKDIESRYPNAAVDWYKAQRNYEYGASFEVRESKVKLHDPEFITGWGAGNPLSDPAKENAAEAATSSGFSSYTTQSAAAKAVQSQGVWKDGKWHVVFMRTLNSSDKKDLQFKKGSVLSAAFAIWDGSHRDRNGQKAVSIWNKLILK